MLHCVTDYDFLNTLILLETTLNEGDIELLTLSLIADEINIYY